MVCPLIAEATIGNDVIAAIIMLATAIGAGLMKGWEYLRKTRKEDETDVIVQMQKMEARCREENQALEQKVSVQDRRIFKLYKHVLYLEGAMRAKRMKFHPINLNEEENKDPLGSDSHDEPMSNSDVYKSLPPKTSEQSTDPEGSD